MKILQISASDCKGGAAKVALYNAEALQEMGHQAELLVANKNLDEEWIHKAPLEKWNNWKKPFYDRAGLTTLNLSSRFPKKLGAKIFSDYDIIHLHDAPSFNLSALPWLCQQAAVVWTFHSMAPFTGGCLYSYGCQKYQEQCGACPEINNFPMKYFGADRTDRVLFKKAKYYQQSCFTPVCVSDWLSSQAEKSATLDKHSISTVLNGISTQQFQKTEKSQARQQLNIPSEKKVILFSVAGNPEDTRKGIDIIQEALTLLPNNDYFLIPLGITGITNSGDQNTELQNFFNKLEIPHLPPQHLETDSQLALHYSAADLIWHPSRADTSSLISMEAMICGTPVIAAAVGGVPEVVSSESGSILIPPENPQALAEETNSLFNDPSRLADITTRSESYAKIHHNSTRMAKDYETLYLSLL